RRPRVRHRYSQQYSDRRHPGRSRAGRGRHHARRNECLCGKSECRYSLGDRYEHPPCRGEISLGVRPPGAGGFQPEGIAITPDGKYAYVATQSANSVSVIDTATKPVVGPPISVGIGPYWVAITPDGADVYVT